MDGNWKVRKCREFPGKLEMGQATGGFNGRVELYCVFVTFLVRNRKVEELA